MDYLGKYPCFSCGKNVMVYEWLPECVLCSKCEAKVRRQEEKAEERR